MKRSKTVTISLTIVFLVTVLFLGYMGFYRNIEPVERAEGGFFVVGLDIVGPYSKVGQHMKKINIELKELGISSSKQIGVYYDSPEIDSNKCHSLVGVILETKEVIGLKEKDLKGFRIDSIPLRKALVIEFPLKNKLSYMLGPVKVYPAFSKYMKEEKYTGVLSFEVYDGEKNKITYVMQYKNMLGL